MDVTCFQMILLPRFRPDVRKIVLALDTTDSQPVQCDFSLRPCFILPVPCRRENVPCCFSKPAHFPFEKQLVIKEQRARVGPLDE